MEIFPEYGVQVHDRISVRAKGSRPVIVHRAVGCEMEVQQNLLQYRNTLGLACAVRADGLEGSRCTFRAAGLARQRLLLPDATEHTHTVGLVLASAYVDATGDVVHNVYYKKKRDNKNNQGC
eukprot:365513-Hanusia_phi.AAC.3